MSVVSFIATNFLQCQLASWSPSAIKVFDIYMYYAGKIILHIFVFAVQGQSTPWSTTIPRLMHHVMSKSSHLVCASVITFPWCLQGHSAFVILPILLTLGTPWFMCAMYTDYYWVHYYMVKPHVHRPSLHDSWCSCFVSLQKSNFFLSSKFFELGLLVGLLW